MSIRSAPLDVERLGAGRPHTVLTSPAAARAQAEPRSGKHGIHGARERRARFEPIPIRGGFISDTVIEDRR